MSAVSQKRPETSGIACITKKNVLLFGRYSFSLILLSLKIFTGIKLHSDEILTCCANVDRNHDGK
jgi:hypothetical protein